MTEGTAICALPGCSTVIEPPEGGGPARRYCSAAHRAAGRKQRQIARLDTGPTMSERVGDPPEPAGPVPPAGQRFSPAASWVIEPRPVPPPRPATRRERRSSPARWTLSREQRRRAVAGVTIASLLLGGVGYVADAPQSSVPAAPERPPVALDPPPNAAKWASRARVVLASLDRQLDELGRAETTLSRDPAARGAHPPPVVVALRERKALLTQQRAAVQSQLAALESLPAAAADVSTSQTQLDAIEMAIQQAPGDDPTSPARTVTRTQLETQRALRAQQRDQNMQELATLRDGVAQAIAAPLPDPADDTTPLVTSVEQLMSHQTDPRRSSPEQYRTPEVVVPRQSPSARPPERTDFGTAGPPDASSSSGGSGVRTGDTAQGTQPGDSGQGARPGDPGAGAQSGDPGAGAQAADTAAGRSGQGRPGPFRLAEFVVSGSPASGGSADASAPAGGGQGAGRRGDDGAGSGVPSTGAGSAGYPSAGPDRGAGALGAGGHGRGPDAATAADPSAAGGSGRNRSSGGLPGGTYGPVVPPGTQTGITGPADRGRRSPGAGAAAGQPAGTGAPTTGAGPITGAGPATGLRPSPHPRPATTTAPATGAATTPGTATATGTRPSPHPRPTTPPATGAGPTTGVGATTGTRPSPHPRPTTTTAPATGAGAATPGARPSPHPRPSTTRAGAGPRGATPASAAPTKAGATKPQGKKARQSSPPNGSGRSGGAATSGSGGTAKPATTSRGSAGASTSGSGAGASGGKARATSGRTPPPPSTTAGSKAAPKKSGTSSH